MCMSQSLNSVWLCDSMDYSLPGSSVHRIYQARILEFAIPYPGDLPDWRVIPTSLVSPALAGGFFTTVPQGSTIYFKNSEAKLPVALCLRSEMELLSWGPSQQVFYYVVIRNSEVTLLLALFDTRICFNICFKISCKNIKAICANHAYFYSILCLHKSISEGRVLMII